MKIKNYRFEGFGFPVIFDELPAVKVRGELVPDVDFDKYAKPLIEHICARQDVPFSGNQVNFIRNYFGMSLREFAKMLNVTHQSVMRWEEKRNAASRMDFHTEIFIRLFFLIKIESNEKCLQSAVKKLMTVDKPQSISRYIHFKPIEIVHDTLR